MLIKLAGDVRKPNEPLHKHEVEWMISNVPMLAPLALPLDQ